MIDDLCIRRATAAIMLLVASTQATACGHRLSSNTATSVTSTTMPSNDVAAQRDSLTLAGRAFPLHDVQCRGMSGAVLVTAKTQSGESVIVDAAGGKLETLDFTVDGIGYFWEPTSTGGAPTPVLTQDGDNYTVTGKIKQLHDYTKLSDFTFRATCPH
ncbi:lipoprotein LpqH [Mycobacterium sp. 050128]|uniref:lipoprotein LpqH n=1 Tax=Mycobacterium sp. 050128 TaxID=3096112 RepID=UPI002ED9D220